MDKDAVLGLISGLSRDLILIRSSRVTSFLCAVRQARSHSVSLTMPVLGAEHYHVPGQVKALDRGGQEVWDRVGRRAQIARFLMPSNRGGTGPGKGHVNGYLL